MKIKHTRGNVIVRVNMEEKNSYKLTDKVTIQLMRHEMNPNRRETEPVQGTVIHAEKIPTGATVLIHHNACQPSYEIFDVKDEINFKTFSIPEDMVFVYSVDGEEFVPCENFLITLRVFEPYRGFLVGIDPELVKRRMFVVEGEVKHNTPCKGKVVFTLKNTDYEIVFQGKDGREKRLIRSRSRELLGVDNILTEKFYNNELLIGLNPTDAKNYNDYRATKKAN